MEIKVPCEKFTIKRYNHILIHCVQVPSISLGLYVGNIKAVKTQNFATYVGEKSPLMN